MRQVKCRNCGTFIDKDKAISVQSGKTKAFYCNENCMKSAQEREIAAQKEKEEKGNFGVTVNRRYNCYYKC